MLWLQGLDHPQRGEKQAKPSPGYYDNGGSPPSSDPKTHQGKGHFKIVSGWSGSREGVVMVTPITSSLTFLDTLMKEGVLIHCYDILPISLL